tara:strand:+ start:2495 stop:2911 length:417 start_codon:yes stop_codon:yes gene_type:complete
MTKTINATKGELVTIINGLFGVQELKGKKFSLVVSKNIAILKETLKDLEDAGKPSEEFLKIAQEVNEIATKNEEGAKEKIDKIEEDNKELVEARRTQMDKVEKMMQESAEVELNTIAEDLLPEDISAQQINKIIKIIE